MTTSTPGPAELAGPLADTAMVNLVREFPYAPAYVLRGPDDLTLPRQRHPAFYGAYDWHSAVHMHWLLVRLLRRHPERVDTAAMRRLLSPHLTPDALNAEADELRPVTAALATEIEVEKDWQTGYVPRVVAVAGAGTRSYLDTFRTEQSLAEIWSVSARDSREAPGVQSRAGSRPT